MGTHATGVVLIGLRRAGKTSVGRVLAQRLQREFVDTDDVVFQTTGKTPGELLLSRGEASYRRVERRAVVRALARSGTVVATGGGVPLREDNRRVLRAHGVVLYLCVSSEELVRRLEADPDRVRRPPLTSEDPVMEVQRLWRERDGLYRALAHHVVDADGSVRDVATRCFDLSRRGLV